MTDHAGQMADAGREWLDRFERETGKTIRDGKLVVIDVIKKLQVMVDSFENYHARQADRVRVSSDVYRQLEAEVVSKRIFVAGRGKSVLAICGVVIQEDPTLPETAMVAERVF